MMIMRRGSNSDFGSNCNSNSIRHSLVILWMLSIFTVDHVIASRKQGERNNRRYKLHIKATIESDRASSTPGNLKFGRWNDEIHDFGRRTAGMATSRLRRMGQSTHQSMLDDNSNFSDMPRMLLLEQSWQAVATSFRDSTPRTDGLQQTSPIIRVPSFGERDSLGGINQHVHIQQMEAFLAAQELQAIIDEMSMSGFSVRTQPPIIAIELNAILLNIIPLVRCNSNYNRRCPFNQCSLRYQQVKHSNLHRDQCQHNLHRPPPLFLL